MAASSTSGPVFVSQSSGSSTSWLLPFGVVVAVLSLLLLAAAATPGWAVSSPPVARFLDQHRTDFTFTGFALLTGIMILSAMVALSGA